MKSNKEYWNNIAQTWSTSVQNDEDVLRNKFIKPMFLKFLGPIKNKIILDVGCGDGSYAKYFAKHNKRVIGIDFSEKMINIANDQLRNLQNLEFIVADMTKLSVFKDTSIDTVIAPMSLMDCMDLKKAVHEIYRVLKKRGEFFASVLHPCFITNESSWAKCNGSAVARQVARYFDTKAQITKWAINCNNTRNL